MIHLFRCIHFVYSKEDDNSDENASKNDHYNGGAVNCHDVVDF